MKIKRNSNSSFICQASSRVGSGSNVRPSAEQIVINAGKLDDGRMLGRLRADALNRHVQIEEKRALPVVAHHALHPEEGRQPRAARHWTHMMEAGRGIENQ